MRFDQTERGAEPDAGQMLVGDWQQLPAEPQEILADARRDRTGSAVTAGPSLNFGTPA